MEKMHVAEYYKKELNGKEIVIKPQKSWKYIKERNKGNDDLIAFSENGKIIRYGDMYEQWEEVARVLSGLDIYRGNNSRILVMMPNLTKTGILTYGSDMTGAVVDFIDPTTPYDKIRKYIETEGITDIFSLDLLLLQNVGKKVEELKKDYNLKNIIVYKDNFMNSLMPRKVKFVSNIINSINRFSKNIIRYEDAVKETKNTRISYDSTDGNILDFITHTSGTTTGIGKPIPLTDHNRNSLVNEYDLANYKYESGMKMIHFIPYFAGYGTVNTAHLGLSKGLELQQIPLFNPLNFGDYMATLEPNVVIANTPCWLSLINNPKYQNIDLSQLVIAGSGGTPTSIDDERKINDFFKNHGCNTKLYIGYGMSELAGCVVTATNNYQKEGTLGVPLPGVDIKFRNIETGEITSSNNNKQYGEALIHSETMTSGILDGKEIIPILDINGKKYIKTKDIMSSDDLGFITYNGRIDGAFQRYDAYNIYPLHIEELFLSYPEIVNCALVPKNKEELNGKIPKIYIELDKTKYYDKEQLIDNIIQNSFLTNLHKSSYEANFRDLPHEWVFVDSIPKNTMGKNDMHALNSGYITGDTYDLDIEEDNLSIKSYKILKISKETKMR